MAHLEDSQALSARLRTAAESVLTHLVPEGEPVAVLDYPYSDNFGDAAIWAGQNVLLDQRGNRRRYVCDVGRYDPADLRAAHPSGPILLHGGGNFGDYWPEHQQFRERVLTDFPDRRIVQLPQTLGFQNPANMAAVSRQMTSHSDFTVLARDEASVQLGSHLGLRTLLCPDSATHMGPLKRVGLPELGVLVLARTDHEGGGLRQAASGWPVEFAVEEWRFGTAQRGRWTALKTVPRTYRRLPGGARGVRNRVQPLLAAAYDGMARTSVSAAVSQLSRARVVVTDRLHAHVLATLLGIPNIVLDNNYGKVKGIFDAFTHTSDVATMVATPEEARVLAERHLS